MKRHPDKIKVIVDWYGESRWCTVIEQRRKFSELEMVVGPNYRTKKHAEKAAKRLRKLLGIK